MTRPIKTPVPAQVITRRCNRVLAAKRQRLFHARRNSTTRKIVGEYFSVDLARNRVIATDLDLAKFAKKIGAMAEWEEIAARQSRPWG